MKKTFTMLLALFAFSLSMFAGNPGVTFLLRSGKKVSFTFAEKPVIALSDANLSVSVRGVERVSYAYADVQRVVVEMMSLVLSIMWWPMTRANMLSSHFLPVR